MRPSRSPTSTATVGPTSFRISSAATFYGATATVLLNEGGHFTAVAGSTLGTFEGLYEFVHERDGRLDLFTINPSFNGIPEGD